MICSPPHPSPTLLEEIAPLALLESLQGQPRWAWFAPNETLIAWGCAATIQADDVDNLSTKLDKLSRSGNLPPNEDIRLFGGLPFDPAHAPDSLWACFRYPTFTLPRYIYRQTPQETHLTLIDPDETFPILQKETSTESLPSARWQDDLDYPQWESMVNAARHEIKSGDLQKVVFARTRTVTYEHPPTLTTAFANLCQRYPSTYRFYFEPHPGHVFMGATPELLASAHGQDLETVALAGSAPRGQTPQEDQHLGAELLVSKKDRHEQEIVVERIRTELNHLSNHFEIPETPHLRRLPNIQHLETKIHARLHRRGILDAANALHPTPALAGQPRKDAMKMIREYEPTPRGIYGAPVGWITPQGDGLLTVAIRSAIFNGQQGRLYAGAGMVAASQPKKEWDETALKFIPMMEALGLREKEEEQV